MKSTIVMYPYQRGICPLYIQRLRLRGPGLRCGSQTEYQAELLVVDLKPARSISTRVRGNQRSYTLASHSQCDLLCM